MQEGVIKAQAINLGDELTLTAEGTSLVVRQRGTEVLRINRTGVGWNAVAPVAQPSAYTQTFATADKTHADDGSADAAAATATAIAAAVTAATATAIAAAIPAAAPAGGTGATAGAYDTAVNRDAAIATINELRTWAIEMDLDYEALLVDAANIRTWSTEVDLDYEALLVDVADIRTQFNSLRTTMGDIKQLVNSVIDDLQALGLVG